MVTKEQLLGLAGTIKTHSVQIKDMGEVCIKVMSGTEREAWEQQVFTNGKASLEHIRAKLLSKVLCQPDGTRLFTDDDIPAISEMPAPILIALFDKAQKFNAFSSEDIDELVGNS